MGAAFELGKHWQLLTELAAPISVADIYISENNYFRIQPELRFVYSKPSKPGRGYFGFQSSYAFRFWISYGSGIYSEKEFQDSVIAFSYAHIHALVTTCSLQYGYLFRINEHFILDCFLGTGTRFIFTDYTDLKDPVKTYNNFSTTKCGIFPFSNDAYNVNSTLRRYHFNTGFRLLFRF